MSFICWSARSHSTAGSVVKTHVLVSRYICSYNTVEGRYTDRLARSTLCYSSDTRYFDCTVTSAKLADQTVNASLSINIDEVLVRNTATLKVKHVPYFQIREEREKNPFVEAALWLFAMRGGLPLGLKDGHRQLKYCLQSEAAVIFECTAC